MIDLMRDPELNLDFLLPKDWGNATVPSQLFFKLENNILGRSLTNDFIISPSKFVRKEKLHQIARFY